jgi:CDP-glycerol glycerophosphotransferase (TagB/SpsB family)
VIYTQFDYEDVFSNHIYDEGYFDYRRDGLGPVCEDLDSTVEEIYKSIENDCKLEKRYRERIDNFFEFDDRNNSKRVYEAIRKL